MNTIKSICDYVYENYPGVKETFPRWKLLSLFDRNDQRIIIIEEGDRIRGVGCFFKLDNDTLTRLLLGELAISQPDEFIPLLKQEGDNIHFFMLLADGYRTIKEGIRRTIKEHNPKTISWFEPDMSDLHFYVMKGRV